MSRRYIILHKPPNCEEKKADHAKTEKNRMKDLDFFRLVNMAPVRLDGKEFCPFTGPPVDL